VVLIRNGIDGDVNGLPFALIMMKVTVYQAKFYFLFVQIFMAAKK
jgi:hypothetical protein